MVHAYAVLLRLYPRPFRDRYATEMSLDFEDALCVARAGGWVAVGALAMRALGDLAVSLPREWTRTGRVGFTAATAGLTALLWGLALRPWAWRNVQPGPPAHAHGAPPVTEAELLVLAVLALLPVVVVILFAWHLRRASLDVREPGWPSPECPQEQRRFRSRPIECCRIRENSEPFQNQVLETRSRAQSTSSQAAEWRRSTHSD